MRFTTILQTRNYKLPWLLLQRLVVHLELRPRPQFLEPLLVARVLLVASQPTRGLDVGAIEFVHQQIIGERGSGKAILLVSMELEEVMSLSDRILVMYEGKIAAEFEGGGVNEETLGYYMTGGRDDVAEDGTARRHDV